MTFFARCPPGMAYYQTYSRRISLTQHCLPVEIPCKTQAAPCRHGAAVSVGMLLYSFWITSVSDPGYVTADNLGGHLQLYPQPSPAKLECRTCHQARPANSKHCPFCDRSFPSCTSDNVLFLLTARLEVTIGQRKICTQLPILKSATTS
jgi:hypothetical protein